MGGKKKKKHFVDTSVRVNTVTKETKEENNSKNDGHLSHQNLSLRSLLGITIQKKSRLYYYNQRSKFEAFYLTKTQVTYGYI